MRTLKLFSAVFLALLLFTSCEKEVESQIVFFSKDQLKKELAVNINNTEGSTVSINSNAIIDLNSSKVFKDNIDYLKNVEVESFNFKIKNFEINPCSKFSNIGIYVDEIKISGNDISLDYISLFSSSFEFKINNQEILSAISSKLLQKKQIVVSYYSDAVSDDLFNFDLEFNLTTKGTFVD